MRGHHVHSSWYGPPTWRTWLLAPAALVYALIVRIWHLAFDLGLRRATKIPGATVISVGNLVVGGSGKTPVVIHLTNAALAKGHRVAVLTRGYGRTSTNVFSFTAASLPRVEEVGDEPRLIARRCPGATVWVGADRVDLARRAVAAGANLLLLDDGFQHRRLARDVDLLVDAGLGNGWVLPAGPLREPAAGRKRATHIWGRDGRPGEVEARHHLTAVRAPDGTALPLSALEGQSVVLLLGVARPDLVRSSVEARGATVRAMRVFPDHHLFTPAELATSGAPDAWLLTTEKDAERLPAGSAHVLILDVEVTRGTLPIPPRDTNGGTEKEPRKSPLPSRGQGE